MKFGGVGAVVLATAAAVCSPALAGAVLDQHSIPETGVVATLSASGFEVELFNPVGQTFTVGVAGTLSRIDLGLYQFFVDTPTTPAQFSLRTLGGTTLFATDIPLAHIPLFQFGVSDWSDGPQVDL